MCYEASQLALKILKDAIRVGASKDEIEVLKDKVYQLKKQFENLYRVCGYDHPNMFIFNGTDKKLELAEWGLIPTWIKSDADKNEIQSKTLNARIETLFEKKSFKESAEKSRCLIPLEGFFEYHHKNGKTFSHYITHPEKNLLVAGISSNWNGKSTFSMVTTKANEFMAAIHNNPKLNEPRMPLILQESQVDEWLFGSEVDLKLLGQRTNEIQLVKKTVKPIKGKGGIGNSPEAQQYFYYPGMEDIPTLFD